MAKVEKKFGPIEPLDRVKMKVWMGEPGVIKVAVSEMLNRDVSMQRVGLVDNTVYGVKKRFQKAPKNKK